MVHWCLYVDIFCWVRGVYAVAGSDGCSSLDDAEKGGAHGGEGLGGTCGLRLVGGDTAGWCESVTDWNVAGSGSAVTCRLR